MRRIIVKAVAVTGAVLASLGFITSTAQAAGPEPRVWCGDTVTWSVQDRHGPTNAGDLVRWAYSQVVPLTGISANRGGWAVVEWRWQPTWRVSQGTGLIHTSREVSYSGLSPWVHALDGSSSVSESMWRQMILRAVVEDFGVSESTATATGLSADDRSALQALCESQGIITEAAADDEGASEPRHWSSYVGTDGDSQHPDTTEPSAGDEPAATPPVPDAYSSPRSAVKPVQVLADTSPNDGGGGAPWVPIAVVAMGVVSLSTCAGAYLGAKGRRVASQ